MEILLKDLQRKLRLNQSLIQKIVKEVLSYQKVKQARLSIVFVTHQKIRALNIQYLNRNHTTDVLAFDLNNQTQSKKATHTRITHVIGDIIISTDAVIKNAKAFKTANSRELSLYVVHGILHLLGYDDHGAKKH